MTNNNYPLPKNTSQEAFNQYMLSALEHSIEYSHRLMQQSYNAIQLFLSLITALTGGGIVIISTIDDGFLKLSLLALIFLAGAGFGTLTYLWVISSVIHEMQEKPIRFFIEKYFRDLDPTAYEKYGLSRLLVPYSRFQNIEYVPISKKLSSISLVVLAIFTSILISAFSYIVGYLLVLKWNVLISIATGVIWLTILIVYERVLNSRVNNKIGLAKEIYEAYHVEKPDGKNLVANLETSQKTNTAAQQSVHPTGGTRRAKKK